ncbi:conserved hypothetical protein [Candidatus Magnetomoraceae bacterium gMMP-15]
MVDCIRHSENIIKYRKQYINIAMKHVKPGSGSNHNFLRNRTLTYTFFDLRKILSLTPFIIVGGAATRLYMPERMTLDLVILVAVEDGNRIEEELTQAGCQKQGSLSIGGSTWILPDKSILDVIILDFPWISDAIQNPNIASDGLPYIDLPYLVLMKLQSGRAQDIADISRMMGCADEKSLKQTRMIVKQYFPDDIEDLESLILLGKLEMER